MAASALSEQARVELARAVLAHAELRTGARSVRVGTRPAESSAHLAEGTQHGSGDRSTTAGGTPVPFAADPVRAAARPSSGSRSTERGVSSAAVPGASPHDASSSAHDTSWSARREVVRGASPDGTGAASGHDAAPAAAVLAASRPVPTDRTAQPHVAPTDRTAQPHAVPTDRTAQPHVAPTDRTLPSRAADEAWARSHPTAPASRPAGVLAAERPPLPVPDRLAPLLPDGLRRGATTAVVGSTSLVLTMLAHACAGGAWAAVVGQPTVGLLAAAEAGVALERLALVPRPGQDAATVVAALVDGIDVVLVGPDAVLTDSDRRRLSARARDRGAVLLSSVAWPGASTVLTVEAGRWWGVGAGDGRLRTHELRVTRSGRGGSAVPLSVDVTLPLSADAPSVTAAPAVPAAPAEIVEEQAATGLRLVG